jgi:hypothetical protein
MAFPKKMTPLTKGGSTTAHAGKGSIQAPLSTRNNVKSSGSGMPPAPGQAPPTINNYAKSTPMPGPSAPAPDGLGSGTWPGIGQ